MKLFPVKQKDFNVAEIFGVSTKECRANIAGINFGEIYADFELKNKNEDFNFMKYSKKIKNGAHE